MSFASTYRAILAFLTLAIGISVLSFGPRVRREERRIVLEFLTTTVGARDRAGD